MGSPPATATRHAAAAEPALLAALRRTAHTMFGTEPAYAGLGLVSTWRGAPGEGFHVAGFATNGKAGTWRQALSVDAYFAGADGIPTRVVARYRAEGVALERAVPVGEHGLGDAATRALAGL